MFIYNVTVKPDWNIHDAWVKWMLNEYMPALLQTNCFMQYKLLRLHEQDDTEGPTYIAQYFTESKALYDRYIELYADAFRRDVKEKWGENFVAFRTLMEVVH